MKMIVNAVINERRELGEDFRDESRETQESLRLWDVIWGYAG